MCECAWHLCGYMARMYDCVCVCVCVCVACINKCVLGPHCYWQRVTQRPLRPPVVVFFHLLVLKYTHSHIHTPCKVKIDSKWILCPLPAAQPHPSRQVTLGFLVLAFCPCLNQPCISCPCPSPLPSGVRPWPGGMSPRCRGEGGQGAVCWPVWL